MTNVFMVGIENSIKTNNGDNLHNVAYFKNMVLVWFFSLKNNNSYNNQQLFGNSLSWNFKIIIWNAIATNITFYKQHWISEEKNHWCHHYKYSVYSKEHRDSFCSWAIGFSLKNQWGKGCLYTHLIKGNQSDAKAGFQNFRIFYYSSWAWRRISIFVSILHLYTVLNHIFINHVFNQCHYYLYLYTVLMTSFVSVFWCFGILETCWPWRDCLFGLANS